MQLERETLRRMAECFGERSCCPCGRPAERLAHNRFYCGRHFPAFRLPGGGPLPKVYKCHPDRRGDW
jgi:hypothetical protein